MTSWVEEAQGQEAQGHLEPPCSMKAPVWYSDRRMEHWVSYPHGGRGDDTVAGGARCTGDMYNKRWVLCGAACGPYSMGLGVSAVPNHAEVRQP